MIGTRMLKQLRDAITNLNPQEVRDAAKRPVRVALVCSHPESYEAMEKFLLPEATSDGKRAVAKRDVLHRMGEAVSSPADLYFTDPQIVQPAPVQPRTYFTFHAERPGDMVEEVLKEREDLSLPLARHFRPFRDCHSSRTVLAVSRENALFSLATAVPSVVPFLALPWTAGEFASDTAFITMNQIRMAFLLAAASDRPVGYKEQKAEIASLFAGAFGWRALARELVGKIPMGGGLLPKAAIAFAGTFVVGASLERYYRLGYGFTAAERKDAYQDAYEKGKAVASNLLDSYRKRPEAKV